MGARPGRLTGLDLARCLALVGMVVTHVAASRAADGSLTFGHWLAGGRASALFAVLAGVGLALATGGRTPVRGRERSARSAGVATRALIVAAVGITIGGLDSGLAVILTYYGALFLLALPFLGLSSRALFVLAGGWVVVVPLLAQVVRAHLAPHGVESPNVEFLTDPGRLVTELLLTGYYPALQWTAYLLVGLGVGRLDLGCRRILGRLVAVGALLAVGATVLSGLLVSRADVARALLTEPPQGSSTIEGLLAQISTGMYGVTPPGGAWQWLLVVAPHSATPFDLAQTIGSAMIVIGLCLLLTSVASPRSRRFVAVLSGAGAMTLSLYTLHVWLHTPGIWPDDGPEGLRAHVLVLLAIGAAFAAAGVRGPLEALARWCSGLVAQWVRTA